MSDDDVVPTPPPCDRRGHPTTIRLWNPKTVCGRIFAERVSERQISLSEDGETKDIGRYSQALREIFSELSAEEKGQCETLCEEWNSMPPSEQFQRK